MRDYFSCGGRCRLWPLAVAAALALSGCASSGAPTQSVQTIADTGTLRVAIEPRSAAAAPNDQPVQLRPGRLRALLASLKVRVGYSRHPVRLFPVKQIPALASALVEGLSKASPDQDVVLFAFRARHGTAGFFTMRRRDTTARVFYRDGAVNMIFGDIDKFYNEFIDRSLEPLEPGSRAKPSGDTGGRLVAPAAIAFVDHRHDWIRAGAKVARTGAKGAAPKPRSARGPEPHVLSKPAHAPAVNSSAAKRNVNPSKPAKSKAISTDAWAKLEARLKELKKLHDEGLISDKDYAAEKKRLLEALNL